MFDKLIPVLRKIPALKQSDDREIKSILSEVASNIVSYEAEQTIIRESAIDNHIYIILDGEVGLFTSHHESGGETPISELRAGGMIGEIDLNEESVQEYTGTIRTLEKTTLFKIDRQLLGNHLKQRETEKRREKEKELFDKDKLPPSAHENSKEIIDTLTKTGLFRKVNQQELATIDDWLEIIDVYEGNVILKEGTSGDGFFVIMEGELEVFTRNKKSNMCVLASLGPGDYFGEQALLDGDKGLRSASVMAVAPSRLIKIPKVMFRKIIRRDHELYIELSKKKFIQKLENEQAVRW